MIGRSGDRKTAILLVALLLHPAFSLEGEKRSVCVAPLPMTAAESPTGTPELSCKTREYSLTIDGQRTITWPKSESLTIDDLSISGRHRVVVLCHGKPQQSFTFRFSNYKGKKLCLFFNDLYWTVQLWEANRTPWCKCK